MPGECSRRPDDVHEALRPRAAAEGASLSELVLHQIRTTAARASNAEIMARAARLSGHLGLEEAVESVRTGRERYPQAVLLARAWELRGTLTAYDAQYAAPTEPLDAPLVICHGPLSRAPGPRCRVELLC